MPKSLPNASSGTVSVRCFESSSPSDTGDSGPSDAIRMELLPGASALFPAGSDETLPTALPAAFAATGVLATASEDELDHGANRQSSTAVTTSASAAAAAP